MEKKLLLLGTLRSHEMHGYQFNEMLSQSVGIPIKLTKPNAYKLLKKMEQDGWITYREEQVGNRPPRRVYQITDAGEVVFQEMLRESLAAYSSPEFPSTVAFNFLELLPDDEAVVLLQQRREKVITLFDEIDGVPVEMREAHRGVEYLYRFYQTEIEWLDEMIARLSGVWHET
jgi:DNA-binding PadR family transcriptional regulator